MLLRSFSEDFNLATQFLLSFHITATNTWRYSRIFVCKMFTTFFHLLPLWRQNHQKLDIVIATNFLWITFSDVYVIILMQNLYFLTILVLPFSSILFIFLTAFYLFKAEMKRFTSSDTSVLKQHYEKKVNELEQEKKGFAG